MEVINCGLNRISITTTFIYSVNKNHVLNIISLWFSWNCETFTLKQITLNSRCFDDRKSQLYFESVKLQVSLEITKLISVLDENGVTIINMNQANSKYEIYETLELYI